MAVLLVHREAVVRLNGPIASRRRPAFPVTNPAAVAIPAAAVATQAEVAPAGAGLVPIGPPVLDRVGMRIVPPVIGPRAAASAPVRTAGTNGVRRTT